MSLKTTLQCLEFTTYLFSCIRKIQTAHGQFHLQMRKQYMHYHAKPCPTRRLFTRAVQILSNPAFSNMVLKKCQNRIQSLLPTRSLNMVKDDAIAYCFRDDLTSDNPTSPNAGTVTFAHYWNSGPRLITDWAAHPFAVHCHNNCRHSLFSIEVLTQQQKIRWSQSMKHH